MGVASRGKTRRVTGHRRRTSKKPKVPTRKCTQDTTRTRAQSGLRACGPSKCDSRRSIHQSFAGKQTIGKARAWQWLSVEVRGAVLLSLLLSQSRGGERLDICCGWRGGCACPTPQQQDEKTDGIRGLRRSGVAGRTDGEKIASRHCAQSSSIHPPCSRSWKRHP